MRTHLLARTVKIHGKELSFNNLLDLDSGRRLLREFEVPAAARSSSTTTPVGGESGETALGGLRARARVRPAERFRRRGRLQPQGRAGSSATQAEREFRRADLRAGIRATRRSRSSSSKPNVRIIEDSERRKGTPGERDLRRVTGGLIVQDADNDIEDRAHMEVVTERKPTEEEWGDLLFAWKVCKHVRSNAIVLAQGLATIGIGAGQMSRVDSVRLAVEKAPRESRRPRSRAPRWPRMRSSPSPTARGGDRGGCDGGHPARRLAARPRGDRGRQPGRHRDGLHRPAPLPALSHQAPT